MGARTRSRVPYTGAYINRRGLGPTVDELGQRMRRLELAPRQELRPEIDLNIFQAIGAAGPPGGAFPHSIISPTHTDTSGTPFAGAIMRYNGTVWTPQPVAGIGARSATRIVAGNDALQTSKDGADHVCDGVADDYEINLALSELPAMGTLHLVGTFNVTDTIKAIQANIRIEFEGGATIKWLTVPAARPILHLANSKIDVIDPRVQGTGSKGDGVGILMVQGQTYLTTAITGALVAGTVDVVSTAAFAASGSFAVRGITYAYTAKTATQFTGVTGGVAADTFSIGENVGLTTDAGSHDCTLYSPEVLNCSEGVTFGIIEGQSTGDCNIFGGALHGCKTGIMSRGFTNRAYGTRVYTNNINIDCTNERTSQKFEGIGMTLSQWATQCIRVRSGNGSTFHNTWMEHTGGGTPTEAVLLGGHTTLGDKTNREVLGVRFTGTTKITLAGETYAFRLYNCRDLYVEHLTVSTNGDPPSGAMIRAESTLTGTNNRFKAIVLSPGSGGLNVFTGTYPTVFSNAGAAGSEVIVEQHYDVENSPAGTTIGGSVLPAITADYTIFRTLNAALPTYFAKSKNGHIASFAADTAAVSGLRFVLNALKANNTSFYFPAGTYSFIEEQTGNHDHMTYSALVGLRFEGDPSLGSIISNWRDDTPYPTGTDTDVDSEPLSFTRCNEVTIRNLRIWAGGNQDLNNSSDGLDFDACRGVHLENVLIERSRARGLVFDGGDSGAISRRSSIHLCEVRGIPPPLNVFNATAAGTLTQQEYRYCVTYVDSVYGETPPSDFTSWLPTTGTKQASIIVPTGPFFSATKGVTARKIYRWSAAQTSYRLLTTISDNTTTSYTDNASDASISAAATVPLTGTCLIPKEGIKILGADRQNVSMNEVIGVSSHGIQIVRKGSTAANNKNSDGHRVMGNNVRFAGKGTTTGSIAGIYIGGGSRNLVSGNEISNIGIEAVADRGIGIYVQGLVDAETEYNLIGPNNIYDDQDANTPAGGATTKIGIQLNTVGGGTQPDHTYLNPGAISGMTSSSINDLSSTNTIQYSQTDHTHVGSSDPSPVVPRWITGRYYGARSTFGWNTMAGQALSANTIHGTPFFCPQNVTVTTIACNVTIAGAGSSKLRMGIYNIGTDGRPTTLVAESADVAADSTGLKTTAISAVLTGGAWFFAAIVSDSTPSVNGWAAGTAHSPNYMGSVDPSSTGTYTSVEKVIGAGWTVMPANFPSAPTPTGVNVAVEVTF